MGIRLNDIINKNSITVVINTKTKEARKIVFDKDTRATLKFILAAFFDTNKISKKDKILDEKEQVEFYNKIKKYLTPQGAKRVLTRGALLKMKDDIFGKNPAQGTAAFMWEKIKVSSARTIEPAESKKTKKAAAKISQTPAPKLKYTFYRHKISGAPAYCAYQFNGRDGYDERWYIVLPTGKIEFIDKRDIEPSLETSFEEIWQKRNPRRFDIGDWAPEGDYAVIDSKGCSPITLNTTIKNGKIVIQSPLCENKNINTAGTLIPIWMLFTGGLYKYSPENPIAFSNETCVLKFLTEEHAKKFFEKLLYKVNELQGKLKKPTENNPHPKDPSGLWRLYNEVLYRRLWVCKRGGCADSLAIDIGGMIPPPKIKKDAYGSNVAENLEEINLGFEFQRTLVSAYRDTLQEVTGGNYTFFDKDKDAKNIKDIGPREQKEYFKFCVKTKKMSKDEAINFRARTIAQQVQKHDDGFWANAWGKLTLWMETGDKVCQTGYHMADVRKAAYAVSPQIGKYGSKERKEYNAFMKLYLPRIKSGELLVFNIPTVPSNWMTNFFIPQYSNVGNYIHAERDKATRYSDMHGSGKGVILLVKNTPETRKIYEKAANDAWNVNALNAFFNADTWEEFNTVQKRYEMFDEGVEEVMEKWDDYMKGTQDIDRLDPFDDDINDKTETAKQKKSELILTLHALYGLVIGFRIMTDFGCNYVSEAHFTANLVNFIPGIYDMIKMFRYSQKPEDMLQLLFMTVGILNGHKPFSAGYNMRVHFENKVPVIRNNRGVVQKVTGEMLQGVLENQALLKLTTKALGYKQKIYTYFKKYERPQKDLHPKEVNLHPDGKRTVFGGTERNRQAREMYTIKKPDAITKSMRRHENKKVKK